MLKIAVNLTFSPARRRLHDRRSAIGGRNCEFDGVVPLSNKTLRVYLDTTSYET